MERSSCSMGILFPASSRSTCMPREVRTCAAMPPAAPEPTITASYVLARSTSCGSDGATRIIVISAILHTRAHGLIQTQLLPLDVALSHGVAHPPFTPAQLGGARLDLDEHHAGDLAVAQAVEHHEVHGRAEETYVLGIEREVGEIRHQLLVHLADGHGEAALHGVLAHGAGVARLPQQEAERQRQAREQRDQKNGREAHGAARWRRGGRRRTSPMCGPRWSPPLPSRTGARRLRAAGDPPPAHRSPPAPAGPARGRAGTPGNRPPRTAPPGRSSRPRSGPKSRTGLRSTGGPARDSGPPRRAAPR